MIQSDAATALALAAHRDAIERNKPRVVATDDALRALVRRMVRRQQLDGYRGTIAQWAELARIVER